MRKLGLKIWSNNILYKKDVIKISSMGLCDYVEIYAIPNSFERFSDVWLDIEVPIVIHAPHYSHGMSLSEVAKYDSNMVLLEESIKFADKYNSNFIILHPGMDGVKEECVREINICKDKRFVLENKPFIGKNGKLCNGADIEELKYILNNTGIGFCMDFGHAVCAANGLKIDKNYYLKELLKMNPKMYHLTDGNYEDIIDVHMNYGTGSFPLENMIKMIPDGKMVTDEATKKYSDSLRDFINDAAEFRKIENNLFIK